jgi:hypothetical protein
MIHRFAFGAVPIVLVSTFLYTITFFRVPYCSELYFFLGRGKLYYTYLLYTSPMLYLIWSARSSCFPNSKKTIKPNIG